MIKRLAAAFFVFAVAITASAGTITSLSPSSFDVNSGEQFITIYGTGLGNHLVFDGPAGHFENDASAVYTDRIIGWVPEPVIQKSGTYSLTVTGPNGSSGPATFTVKGFILPLVVLMPEFIRVQPKSRDGAYVTYDVFAAGGKDPSPRVTCDPGSGSFFKMGETIVTCTATNIYGDRAAGSFKVTVRDEEGPLLSLPREPIVVKAGSIEGAFVDYKVTAFDEIWGDTPVDCLPKPGSLFPIGITNVICTATDLELNDSIGSFPIEVLGEIPFYELQLITPDPIFVDAQSEKGTPVDFKIGVKGTEDPDPRVTCTPNSGEYFPVGTTNAVCTAIDKWGMRGTGGFTVTVVDFNFPQILELYAKPDTLIADNRLYPVDIFVNAVDDIDPRPFCEVYDVTSKENINLADEDDPKSYDWLITGQLSLELRAERFGTTRVYNVWVQCTDFFGNRTYTRTPVSVTGGVTGKSTAAPFTGGKRRSAR